MSRTFAIIGGGQTAASAAETLRDEGFDGAIVVVGDEPHVPYERPPLSKDYLQGETEAEDLPCHDQEWYEDNGIEVRLGRRVIAVHPRQRAVELDDGARIVADGILLATGGRPRRLPEVVSDRVLYLRTREDADRIREHLVPGRRVVVVGAGFIGSEVAASARVRGADVTMVELLDTPLQNVLGAQIGRVCAGIQRDAGVDLRTGESVETITSRGDGVVVRTSRGAMVEGDVVVVGIGIIPNVEVAQTAGIAVGNGVLVDEFCRTSLEGVFAAGDVANHFHPLFGRRMRVEHFDNADKHGAAAARSMLGEGEPFADPHWFWSDQYDYNLQHVGNADSWDDLVIRGSVEDCNFTAFYLQAGRLRAAFAVDRGGDIFVARMLIAEGRSPDPQTLADEERELEELLDGI